MQIVMFKNESGDDAYPVCILGQVADADEIEEKCKHLVGDDYDGEWLYGSFYVLDTCNLPAFSELQGD
jgi:hypothetical protein